MLLHLQLIASEGDGVIESYLLVRVRRAAVGGYVSSEAAWRYEASDYSAALAQTIRSFGSLAVGLVNETDQPQELDEVLLTSEDAAAMQAVVDRVGWRRLQCC